MIVRTWEGRTTNAHANIYTKLIEERYIPGYSATEGYVKHVFLKKLDGEYTDFKLLTFWKDLSSIKRFTGQKFAEAVGYQNDRQFLVDFPGLVDHFEVFAESSL